MGKIIDFNEHRLRKFLKEKLGEAEFSRLLIRLPGYKICRLLRYSQESQVVYIDPEAMAHALNTEDESQLRNMNLVLTAFQDAPPEVKALLDQDGVSHHRRAR